VKRDAPALNAFMYERSILLDVEDTRRFRLVTHCWIASEDVDQVVAAFREAVQP
jgi:threonine aldolase